MEITNIFTKCNLKISNRGKYLKIVTKSQFPELKILYIYIGENIRGKMDWFTNMFAPITERTNISPTVNGYYQSVLRYTYSPPLYNFTGGSTHNHGWNFFQNNNWYGSVFEFKGPGSNLSYEENSNTTQNIYNFTGKGKMRDITASQPTDTEGTTNTNLKAGAKSGPAAVSDKDFAKSIALNAEKYLGYNENDGSFRRFSNSSEWCADFVTYVVKETYKNQGKPVPAGFGSWRCENLKQWAIDNDKFLFTAGKPNQRELIKNRVKPGDIVIMREMVGGKLASHTGIVRYVDKETGNYQTIEGNVTENSNDKVIRMNHKYNDPEVSGFIQLT